MLKKKFFYIAAMMAICFMGCSSPEATNKPSDKIGDIAYFKDGKCFVHSGYDSSYGEPIGVVFEVKNGTAQKIVGLDKWDSKPWALNEAEGSEINFETSEDDGSENWNIICNIVGDENGDNLYQAFTCLQYITTAGNQNWYLPAINELKAIAANKEVIKTSIDLLKENTGLEFEFPTTGWFWSSSQAPEFPGCAFFVCLDTNADGSNSKSTYYGVLAVSKLQ